MGSEIGFLGVLLTYVKNISGGIFGARLQKVLIFKG